MSNCFLKDTLRSCANTLIACPESETKSKQPDPSMVPEAVVRKDKKKKKNITVEEDEEGTGMADPDDSDAEMYTTKRQISGDRSKGMRKKSKKQQVA